MRKFKDWLEEHQNEKCRKCPMFWSDGMYSECGCYIQEERYGEFLAKLQDKLESGEYGGCFIPMPIIKLAIFKGNIKDYFYYKPWRKKMAKEKVLTEMVNEYVSENACEYDDISVAREALFCGYKQGATDICKKILEEVRTNEGIEQMTKFYIGEIIKNLGVDIDD